MGKQVIVYQISRRFFFALALLGIFSIISYFVYYSTIKMFEADGAVINISGQQRFLSQKIVFLVQKLISENESFKKDSIRKELGMAISAMEKRHFYLVHGQIPENLFSEEIKKIYFFPPVSLDKKIHQFIETASGLVTPGEGINSNAETLVSSSNALLSGLNLIVEQYQDENEKDIKILHLEKLLLFLATLTLLFLIWKIVFKPATKELRFYINEMIKKDNDLLQSNIDLEKKVEARAKEIREKENTYQTLLENMNEGVAHYTPNGIFTFVNEKYCHILGYERGELINQPIFKIFFKEDVEKIKEKIKLRKIGIGENYEMMLPKKDGEKIWLYISSSTISEKENVTGVLVVITDITEKKETEFLLADLNKFNEILLHTIPLGMQVVDIEGNVLYSNQVMRELAGYDTVGKKCWAVVHDDKMPCNQCLRAQGIEHGKLNVCELQQVFDGKTVHIYQSGINYHHTKAVLELYIDITALKETEQKLVFKNKELQTFISRASHDMRSPVANILGLINILRKESPPEKKQFIDYIEQSANRMDSILIELINIGKVHTDSLNITPINAGELLKDVKLSLAQKNDFSFVNFLPQVTTANNFHSDKTLLYSILHNLIDNASKYRDNRNKEPYVSVQFSDYKNGIRILIADNGQGMTEEVRERAFEMFFKGNLSSTGSGLGLYMVKNFIEKLDGTIHLRSEKDIGTTFTIFLPDLSKKHTGLFEIPKMAQN